MWIFINFLLFSLLWEHEESWIPHPLQATDNSISGQKDVRNKEYKYFKLEKEGIQLLLK